MNILSLKLMRGPNIWSISRHNLVVMLLDIEKFEQLPTDKIKGFHNRLRDTIPTLHDHHCSEGRAGGFLDRVKWGTWLGHVVEHIAIEIQSLAGMYCSFGQTRSAGKQGLYHVVFGYTEEEAGLYAAKAAVRIASALAYNHDPQLQYEVDTLKEIYLDYKLGPSTQSIVEEARHQNIPVYRYPGQSVVQLGIGKNMQQIKATITSKTSNIAVDLACDKERCKKRLENRGIPVATGRVIYSKVELKKAIHELGFPLVTKPNNGNQGKGATINITTWAEALKGFEHAYQYSSKVIVEKFICGSDYRLLVVDNKFVAAAKRTPAMIVGDGQKTIEQLIDHVNQEPTRGRGHENILTQIEVDAVTRDILQEKGYSLDAVLPIDEKLYLKKTANLSTGGTAEDVTDLVHPFNITLAERISKVVGLDICGIDVMATSLTVPLPESGGAVIEVNAAPGFRMHLSPAVGQPRNVAKAVVDMLFPKGKTPRIPVVAITGTNGKTTTTRLIAHLAQIAQKSVGCTTSDGVYIQGEMVEEGDCTGPLSTDMVLQDPVVDFAVLECARGGILKSGLRFSHHDIGIVTNISADHLGLNGVDTLQDLARVKSVVVESVRPGGYAILNADDDLTYQLKNQVSCNVALFSLDAQRERITAHLKRGGMAAVLEDGYVALYIRNKKRKIEAVKNIPLTFEGKAPFMIENVLAAVLAGYLSGFSFSEIKEGLQTFIPSSAQTPGRMNIYDMGDFKVMIDYAHNPAGLMALGKYLNNITSSVKIGVIAGVGDRRDEDIVELGRVAAQIFDEIIIRNDKTLRGRKAQEITDLLLQGIFAHDPNKIVNHIATESDAMNHAVKNAEPGAFIVMCSEKVPKTLKLMEEIKAERKKLVLHATA